MNDDSVINFLKAAAFLVGFFLLDYLLYRLLTLQVHVDPPEFPLHEQPQGGGGNGNRAGQREDHPEQLAAQDGDGEGEAEAEDDPQQEADLGDGEGEGGGGGDQQEDDGSHHQHLPLLLHHRNVLPEIMMLHELIKLSPFKIELCPFKIELKETTVNSGDENDAPGYAMSGKLNDKSALHSLDAILQKLLAEKKPFEALCMLLRPSR